MKKLKEVFSQKGIPSVVIADYVPFGSYEFKTFPEKYKFKLITSSSHYHQSNGLAERGVYTANKYFVARLKVSQAQLIMNKNLLDQNFQLRKGI